MQNSDNIVYTKSSVSIMRSSILDARYPMFNQNVELFSMEISPAITDTESDCGFLRQTFIIL